MVRIYLEVKQRSLFSNLVAILLASLTIIINRSSRYLALLTVITLRSLLELRVLEIKLVLDKEWVA